MDLPLPRISTRAIVVTTLLAVIALVAFGLGATHTHGSPLGATYPAKLTVLRASMEGGRLDVLAEITKRADGDHVGISLNAKGKRVRFTAPIEEGRIRFQRLLPSSQRHASTGIVEISYKGNDRVRPTGVRLRAANRKAGLRRDLLSLTNGTITARGSLTARAQGVVRLVLSYERPDDTVGEWQGRASIRAGGNWHLEENLPADARAGGYVSIQFTGYAPRRIRGEQIAKQLLDGETFVRDATAQGSARKKPRVTGPAPPPPPAPEPPSEPASEPAPEPAPSGKAVTRAVGSPSLTDADAAARVRRSTWEPRPANDTPNHRVPTAAELRAFRDAQSKLDAWNVNPYQQKVTGNFTGTTDEIIQWAAWKWGIDEDIMRAVAVTESWWRQQGIGQDGSYSSFGLMQVLNQYAGSHPLSEVSTAFNADFYGAHIRFVYDGLNRWFMDVPHGKTYVPGDIWGSVGSWFAGAWWTDRAVWYIDIVKSHLSSQTWATYDFKW